MGKGEDKRLRMVEWVTVPVCKVCQQKGTQEGCSACGRNGKNVTVNRECYKIFRNGETPGSVFKCRQCPADHDCLLKKQERP